MKPPIAIVSGVLALLAWEAAAAVPASAAPVTFIVAPNGDDSNLGTLEKPFATIERARDAVLAARAANPPETAYSVELRGGKYFLPMPVTLVKQDSGTKDRPVVYRAFRNEKPVLYGGVPVKGFQPAAGLPGTFVADLASLHLQDVPLGALFQLLPDGQVARLTRARHPNVDPADPIRGGWATAAGDPIPAEADVRGDARKRLVVAKDDLHEWKNPAEGFVNVVTRSQRWNDLVKIASVDKPTRTLNLALDCSQAIQPGDRFFLEGLSEELDAPGEWFYDVRAAKLYVRPPEGVAIGALTVLVPQGRAILSLANKVEHVRLEGLTFRGSEGTAVVLHIATQCVLAGCTIEHCGDYYGVGVAIDQSVGTTVTGCDISHTGSHGIVVEGGTTLGEQQQLRIAENRVINNVVHHPGVCYKQGAGISTVGTGNEVVRNFVYDCPRMGIMVGGNAHLIERNVVRRTNRETEASAAIYVAGSDLITARGAVVRENLIDDTGGLRRDPDGSWAEGQATYGVLLDTHAGGVDVIGNIIVRAGKAGIRTENGRANRIVDNLICDSGAAPTVARMPWAVDDPRWRRDVQAMGWMYDKCVALPAWRKLRGLETSPSECLAQHGTTAVDTVEDRNVSVPGVPESLALDGRGLGPYQDPTRASWPPTEPILSLSSTPSTAVSIGAAP